MKPELSCPVCGHTEISGNSCPNCDTDLSLIRLLTELPPSSPQVPQFEKPSQQPKVAGWQVGVALLILMMGIGLGAVGSFLFLQPPQLLTNTINSPSPVTVSGERKIASLKENRSIPSPIAQKLVNRQQPPSQPTQYTVKLGDNLTAITEQFCGKGKSWQEMVKANPQLKRREDLIDVGEVLKVPNCKDG